MANRSTARGPLAAIAMIMMVGHALSQNGVGLRHPGYDGSPQSAAPLMPQFLSAHFRGTAVVSGNSLLRQRTALGAECSIIGHHLRQDGGWRHGCDFVRRL